MHRHLLSLPLSLAAAVLLSGCVTTQGGQLRLDDVGAWVDAAKTTLTQQQASPEEEARIGRESASMLLGAAPLVQNPELMQFVNQLGTWIARQSERPDLNWRFGVLDSPNVNAFAAPDGYVFVTRGLLRRLDNESELAGVLAHEIGHVVRRHYVVAMHKKGSADALGGLASASAQLAGVKRASYATPLFNVAQNMYSSGLDKADEYEADRLGVVYAARAGYDPYGLPRVLSMYAAHAGDEGFALLFSTHPSAEDRLSELDKVLGDRLVAYETSGVRDSAAFRKMLALAGADADPQRTDAALAAGRRRK